MLAGRHAGWQAGGLAGRRAGSSAIFHRRLCNLSNEVPRPTVSVSTDPDWGGREGAIYYSVDDLTLLEL